MAHKLLVRKIYFLFSDFFHWIFTMFAVASVEHKRTLRLCYLCNTKLFKINVTTNLHDIFMCHALFYWFIIIKDNISTIKVLYDDFNIYLDTAPYLCSQINVRTAENLILYFWWPEMKWQIWAHFIKLRQPIEQILASRLEKNVQNLYGYSRDRSYIFSIIFIKCNLWWTLLRYL